MLPATGAYILDTITHDGYIMGQRFYKLLLVVLFTDSRASYDADLRQASTSQGCGHEQAGGSQNEGPLAEPGSFESGKGSAGVTGSVTEAGISRGHEVLPAVKLLSLEAGTDQALCKI